MPILAKNSLMANENLIIAYEAKRLFTNFTGLGNYSRTLIKNLVTYYPNHQYHLFTPSVIKNTESDFFFSQPNIFIHSPKKDSALWRTFSQSAEINQLKPHIYHGLSHEIPFGIDQDILKVVSFHDLIWEIYPQQFRLLDRLLYALKYKSSARRSDHIVAVSEHTRSDLHSYYGMPLDRISAVYQSCAMEISSEINPSNQRNHFLYVGSIIPRKGLDKIIKAYALIPDNHKRKFVVVGKGSGKYYDECLRLIEYYHLQKYFVFKGSLANYELTKLYDAAIALVFPSIYEGFGIPVIEAISRGCRVITSDRSSLPEAAVAISTLINPDEIHAISDAMQKALLQKEVISSQYLETSLLPFSPLNTSKKLNELYLTLLHSKANLKGTN